MKAHITVGHLKKLRSRKLKLKITCCTMYKQFRRCVKAGSSLNESKVLLMDDFGGERKAFIVKL